MKISKDISYVVTLPQLEIGTGMTKNIARKGNIKIMEC